MVASLNICHLISYTASQPPQHSLFCCLCLPPCSCQLVVDGDTAGWLNVHHSAPWRGPQQHTPGRHVATGWYCQAYAPTLHVSRMRGTARCSKHAKDKCLCLQSCRDVTCGMAAQLDVRGAFVAMSPNINTNSICCVGTQRRITCFGVWAGCA